MTSKKEHYLTYEDLDKKLTLETGTCHVIHFPKQYVLNMRFDVDPKDSSSWDDQFILIMNWNGKIYRQVKTVRDDKVEGDDFVDIMFDKCRPDATYSVQHDLGKEGAPVFLFQDVLFSDIFDEERS